MEKLYLLLTTSPPQYRDYVRVTLKMDLETEIIMTEIDYICRVSRLKAKFERIKSGKGANHEKLSH